MKKFSIEQKVENGYGVSFALHFDNGEAFRVLKIPEWGIEVYREDSPSYAHTHYPVIDGGRRLVNANNGRTVFTHEGDTYVAKSYRLYVLLRDAGFKPHGLTVPFSSGDRIADTSRWFRKLWEALPEYD